MKWSLRVSWVVLAVVLGCGGDDDGGAEGGGSAGTSGAGGSAGASGSAGDPGPMPVVDASEPVDSGGEPTPVDPADGGGGAGGATVDAGMADAAVAPTGPQCLDGEMPCDDECIPVIEPTLEAIETRIFRLSCGLSASCHMGSSPKEGLDLSTADSTLSFVDEPSAQMPKAKLFDTDSPEDSYVLRKLRGMMIAAKSSTGTAATQMPPPPSSPLCAEKIDVIEAWVRAGAKR